MPTCKTCGFEAAEPWQIAQHARVKHPKPANQRKARTRRPQPEPEPEVDPEVQLIADLVAVLTPASEVLDVKALDRAIAICRARFGPT